MSLGTFIGSMGGLFGKKPSVPDYPTQQMREAADREREERQRYALLFKPRAEKQIGTYQSAIDQAKEAALSRGREEASSLMSQLDPLTSRIYQAQADQLKRSIYGEMPAAIQAAREAGAVGGGLQRGAVQSQLASIPIQAAAKYAEGIGNLNVEALKNKQDALSKIYDTNTQIGMRLLGLDENTAINILKTGSEADVNELKALLDEAANYANQQRAIATGQYDVAVAKAAQEAANEAAKWKNIGTAVDTGLDLANQVYSGIRGIPTGTSESNLISRLFKQNKS